MGQTPTVKIIVLNWNGVAYLQACLSAVFALEYPAYEVLMVDNNSADNSVDFVRERFPHAEILKNERNLGYAGGNNQALRSLAADYAVLLNPDVVVSPDWLDRLITAMEGDDAAGIGGCKLLYPDGRTIQHAGGVITHPQALPSHQVTLKVDGGQFEAAPDVDYVTGAAMAIKKEVLESIGFLDEGYFLYFEEADFCTRARHAGYRVVYVPEATAVHDESAFSVKGSLSYLQRFHSGRWRYLLKHFAISEILEESFAAEEQWLLNVRGDERQAVRHAYRAVHMRLDEILARRLADGGGPVTGSARDRLDEGLVRIRTSSSASLMEKQRRDRLAKKGEIHELSFRSSLPLAGVLISQLRSLWAAVAAQEQVKDFTVQQAGFNRLLVEEIEAMEERLVALERKLLAHDKQQIVIGRELANLRMQVSEARKTAERIQQRLGRRGI